MNKNYDSDLTKLLADRQAIIDEIKILREKVNFIELLRDDLDEQIYYLQDLRHAREKAL